MSSLLSSTFVAFSEKSDQILENFFFDFKLSRHGLHTQAEISEL